MDEVVVQRKWHRSVVPVAGVGATVVAAWVTAEGVKGVASAESSVGATVVAAWVTAEGVKGVASAESRVGVGVVAVAA